jgi:peptide deformylase
MSRLTIVEFGDPLLRNISRHVNLEEVNSHEIQLLIKNMIETMRVEKGVGIAAPQVGRLLRIIIVEISDRRSKNNLQITPMINPLIVKQSSEEVEDWEGCLSLPRVRGKVSRPQDIQVTYFDLQGKPASLSLSDFDARVVLHEVDHLNGVLYVDRMKDMSSLSTEKEAERQIQEESRRSHHI